MSVTPQNSTVTVATAGTRVQVVTDSTLRPTSVYFEALKTNTGNIYVGVASVSSTQYIACLTAGQGIAIGTDHVGSSPIAKSAIDIQLSSYFVDSSVSGEKVQVTYFILG